MARSSSSQIARSAGVIGAATMASRVLGLARDQVFAYLFGAGDAMDAFRVAFRLPNLLRDLFAEGAMSAALVPVFTRVLARDGKDSAWRLCGSVVNLAALVTAALSAAGMLFAAPLIGLYAGAFASVPGKFELTVSLTRIMFPFLVLVSVAAAMMGMLNALHRFFIPALAPAMFNVGTIVCGLALVPVAPRLGIAPITALAIGTLVGGAGQVLIQWVALHGEGFRHRIVLDLHDPRLRQIGRLMGPSVAGLAAVQVNLFVNSWLATSLGTGAVSWLDYAFRLMYMPIGLFGVSIATAALPSISDCAATDDVAGMRGSVSSGLRMMLMLNVPATAGLIALASPIVALIYEHGRFGPSDTAATAVALTFYAPGLLGYSFVKLLSPTFYALGNSRIPVIASGASALVNVVLSLLLVQVIGHRGLACGTGVAALCNAGVLLWYLRRRIGGIEGGRLLVAFWKISLASLVMAGAAYESERALRLILAGDGVVVQAVRVFGAIAAGLLTLALSAQVLRIREFTESVRTVVRSR